MNQKRFYKYAIWSLIGLNIAVLAFFVMLRPQPRQHNPQGNFRSEVIEMLHLNTQQASLLNASAEKHTQKMEEIDNRQFRLLSPYFASLITSAENNDKESLLNEYQQLEREKIETTYQHFQEIKDFLDDDQMPYFEEFMRKTTDRILLGKKKNPPPPKDFK
jgi:L-lysine 2,3-aminomutase